MEVLFEILAQIGGFLLQAIYEILLQLIFEVIFEIFIRSIRAPFQIAPVNPILATFGFIIFGAAAGWISLLIFPKLFIPTVWGRWLNLIVTPICAGFFMSYIGKALRKRGKNTIRLETAFYGTIFALSMAIIRLSFGK